VSPCVQMQNQHLRHDTQTHRHTDTQTHRHIYIHPHKHTHKHIHTNAHTHTHAHAHAHKHARARARAHTHTHSKTETHMPTEAMYEKKSVCLFCVSGKNKKYVPLYAYFIDAGLMYENSFIRDLLTRRDLSSQKRPIIRNP